MSESIRLSTPDGTLVFTVPVGAQCQWSTACTRPAVQMRQHPTMGALGVCEAETERAAWFRTVAATHVVQVPDFGPITVVLGGVDVDGRAGCRLAVDGVIVAEGDFSYSLTQGVPNATRQGHEEAVIALCAVLADRTVHLADRWAIAVREWTA